MSKMSKYSAKHGWSTIEDFLELPYGDIENELHVAGFTELINHFKPNRSFGFTIYESNKHEYKFLVAVSLAESTLFIALLESSDLLDLLPKLTSLHKDFLYIDNQREKTENIQ